MKSIMYLTFTIVLCGCAHIIVHPAKQSQRNDHLVGAWFGFEHGFAHTYRLVLNQDGTGIIGRHYYRVTNEVTTYKIDQWSLNGLNLELKIEPDGNNAVSVSGSIGPEYITLLVKGHEWSHTAILNKENRIEHELHILRAGGAGRNEVDSFK